MDFREGGEATFAFRVGARPQGGFEIQEEQCRIDANGQPRASYMVKDGQVQSATFQPRPPASIDRLYLTIASGFPEFRQVFDLLSSMGFYSINPDQVRDLQDPDAGNLLLRDGRNVASVMDRLERQDKEVKDRIEQYLENIAPGVKKVAKRSLGNKETLEFKQTVAGDENPWSFFAQNMSDGTLRAFGVLVSVFQCFGRPAESPIPLVGIEEPEATIHPAAVAVLMEALREASHFTQVLVTSHSPELLDAAELTPESLLIVEAQAGETTIAPADDASRSAMQDRLSTPGELLRLDQLKSQPPAVVSEAEPPVVSDAENGKDFLPLFPDA